MCKEPWEKQVICNNFSFILTLPIKWLNKNGERGFKLFSLQEKNTNMTFSIYIFDKLIL